MAHKHHSSSGPVAREPQHEGVQARQDSGAELQHRIRERAYELFQARNGEPGSDLQDWLQAERELLAEPAPQAASGAAAGGTKGSFSR